MEKRKFNGSGIFVLVVGVVLVGSALSGIMYTNYWLDEAEDCKNAEIFNLIECANYPYQDGNGASNTPASERWTNDETDYKTPYDIYADAVRDQCKIIDECYSTADNFISEIELFCVLEGFTLNGFLNFPGNIAQVIISYEAESGFDMSESLIMIQDVCYPGGAGGTYIQGDLPTLKVPE